MNNGIELKQSIIQQLQTLPVCIPSSNRRNWVVRCPYCGDSKHPKHGHFSILLDLASDAPLFYRCLKCNESGVLTSQILEDLDIIQNRDVIRDLDNYNRVSGNSSFFKDKIKDFYVPLPTECLENYRKLDYINRRLGTQLTFQDCVDYKIILSLTEFLQANRIPVATANSDDPYQVAVKRGIIRPLEEKYLGFLSSNNNKITFRDISQDSSGFFGRYYKLTIDLLNRSPNTFYSLPMQFDLLYTDPIDVCIAEGTFDILGIFKNLRDTVSQNALFIASCGYGFSTIVKYLICIGVTTDVNLHIFSDNDKTDADHRRLLSKGSEHLWIDSITIHRNIFMGEKDFGVPRDHINEFTYKLRL